MWYSATAEIARRAPPSPIGTPPNNRVGLVSFSIVVSTLSLGEFPTVHPAVTHCAWGGAFWALGMLCKHPVVGWVSAFWKWLSRQATAIWRGLGVALKWTINRFVDGCCLVLAGIVTSLTWTWRLLTTLGGCFVVASKWTFNRFVDGFRVAMGWISNDDVVPAEEVEEREAEFEAFLVKILSPTREHTIVFSGL
jgi:hypothetical protein